MTRTIETRSKMCPVSRDVMEKSRKQVEDLFVQFLKISSHFDDFLPKRQSKEVNEVQYEPFPAGRLERDSGKRREGGNNNKCPRPISRGSLPDIDIDFYTKLNKEPVPRLGEPVINPVPPRPGGPVINPFPPRPTIGRDERIEPVSLAAPGYGRPAAAAVARQRTLSVGPTDQQIHDAAIMIAEFGDEIEKKYGDRMSEMGKDITNFVTSATGNIKFNDFACHLNQLMEDGDMNATALMMLLHVGKRVCTNLPNFSEYFGRYVGQRFAERIAQQNDVNVVRFIDDRPTTL